jgi:hypothetical protein
MQPLCSPAIPCKKAAHDNDALDAIVDPRLHFAHATGAVDDKLALSRQDGGRPYRMCRDQLVGRSSAAIVRRCGYATGEMTIDVKVEVVAKRLNNRVIMIWSQADGAWRVVVFQSTPLAG